MRKEKFFFPFILPFFFPYSLLLFFLVKNVLAGYLGMGCAKTAWNPVSLRAPIVQSPLPRFLYSHCHVER